MNRKCEGAEVWHGWTGCAKVVCLWKVAAATVIAIRTDKPESQGDMCFPIILSPVPAQGHFEGHLALMGPSYQNKKQLFNWVYLMIRSYFLAISASRAASSYT